MASRRTLVPAVARKTSAASPAALTLRVDDRDVPVTNPAKILFPGTGHTKLDLVRYYLAVALGRGRHAVLPVGAYG